MIYADLKGKRVLVTGSSSGIGAATAVMFAKQGCFVGVHYFRTKEGGEKTLADVQKHGRGCLLKADMRDEEQVREMMSQYVKEAGGLDVLVNNAGTLLGRVDIEGMSIEHFNDEFATNVRSAFLGAREGLEYLKQSRGCIVNIGSIAGHHGGGPGGGVYAAAKAAVHTLTIAMAKEFSKYGIRVNSVLPGLIETRFHEKFSSAERRKAVAKETPLGRNGTAEDVAKAILFLSSNDAAGFITGEYLAVNGGLYMRA
ncbi:MAG: SDR family oxidoreductase [Planctomycetaceae bacterium]|nr:SDR family oxidoreductase [Planctomycetaceae bacterium]